MDIGCWILDVVERVSVQYPISPIQHPILRGTFQIAKLFNIPVLVHWSFVLIFFWIMYIGRLEGLSMNSMIWLGVFMIALFTCVVLHEFGHALTARYYGVKTFDIILSPIGGVARLQRLPEKPIQEFMVAIAGPLVNVAIALILLPYVFWIGSENAESISEVVFRVMLDFPEKLEFRDYFIPALAFINLGLCVFNLIPAFPMDGGRILRSLLAIPFSRLLATKIASYVGRFMAVGLVIWGLYSGGIFTAMIGVVIFMMAASELKMARVDDMLSKSTVGDVMRIDFTRQYENYHISDVIADTEKSEERNFLVFNIHEELTGVLPQAAIIQAIRDNKKHYQVLDYQLPITEKLYAGDNLKSIFDKMQQDQIHIFPVFTTDDELMGIVDVKAMNDYLRQLDARKKG